MKNCSSPFLLVLSLAMLTLLPACSKKDSDNPTYNFQWTARHYYIGNKIQFSSDAPANAVYLWDFGDNTKSTGATPWHSYQSSGTYSVKLTINGQAQSPKSITIKSMGLSFPANPRIENTALTFTADTALYWDFGDGSSAIGSTVTHTYAHAGDYWFVCMLANDSETLTPGEFSVSKYPAHTHVLVGTHLWHHNTFLEYSWGASNYTYYADTTFAIGYVNDFTVTIGTKHFNFISGNDSLYTYWDTTRLLECNILTGHISLWQSLPLNESGGHAIMGMYDDYYTP
jgi:hypothetical protein